MIKNFTVAQEVALHTTPTPGITSLDIHKDQEQYIITGGVNGSISLYDRETANVFQNTQSVFEDKLIGCCDI